MELAWPRTYSGKIAKKLMAPEDAEKQSQGLFCALFS